MTDCVPAFIAWWRFKSYLYCDEKEQVTNAVSWDHVARHNEEV